ncbi:TPA: MucBP domain-containing protein [Streptococcus suis]
MEKKHKYGFRKHKAVKGLGVALLGTVGVLAGSSLVSANETTNSAVVQTNRTVDATISRVNFNDLTVEQKARIKSGNIDEQLSWINPETGNFEWITGFVAVYKPSGSCQVVPVDPEPIQPILPIPPSLVPQIPVVPGTPQVPQIPVVPGTPQVPQIPAVPGTPQVEPQVPVAPVVTVTPKAETPSTVAQTVSRITGIPAKSVQSILPKTGSASSKTIAIAGLGMLTFGGYLLFKNRKTGKHVAIALLVAGSIGVSTPVLANSSTFLDLVENVKLQLNARFTHTPATDTCWEYVGYYPEIASVPAETPTSPNTLPSADLTTETQENKGKVTVHYVDEEGNTIAASKELVNAVVSTTYRTKVTVNGVEEIKENTVPNDLDYNAAALKVNTIESNGDTYEFVAVKGNETGKVVAGETEVTYVYRKVAQPVVTREELDPIQETGKVTVHYVDEAGNKLADSKELVNAILSTTFRTKVTTDGVEEIKENKVVSDATYNAAAVKATVLEYNGDTYEFVAVKGNETGQVVAGETEVTYVYRKVAQPVVTREELDPIQETGKVTVHYVDEAGNKLADSKELVSAVISTTFRTKVTTDGVEEIKENKVVSDATYNAAAVKAAVLEYNGDTYEFVAVEGNETGKVVAGDTTVSYVYRKVAQPVVIRKVLDPVQETGTVNVHFVDEEGTPIAPSKELLSGAVNIISRTSITTDGVEEIQTTTTPTGVTYNADSIRQDAITFNNNNYAFKGLAENSAPSQGTLKVGTTDVTFVYQLKNNTRTETEEVTETKGSVIVRYQDEAGNTLKPEVSLVTDRVVTRTTVNRTYIDGVPTDRDTKVENIGGIYNAATVKEERITTNDGVYVLAGINGAEVESVTEGTTYVTYIYRKLEASTKEIRGTVITRYVNEVTGEEIVPSTKVVDNQLVATVETTAIKGADGSIVDTKTVTTPTYLLYNTTLDKAAKDKVIAGMLTSPVEFLDTTTGATGQIVNNTIVKGTKTFVAYVAKSDAPAMNQNIDYREQAIARGFDPATEVERFNGTRQDKVGENYYETRYYSYTYTKEITEEAPKVPYIFSHVDVVEVGHVKEGETIITYYYKPASLSVTPTVEYDSIGLTQSTVAA